MATQAQNMGSVKDIQTHLRHAKADANANEYMQELPEACRRWLSDYLMLASGAEQNRGDGEMQQNLTQSLHVEGAKSLKRLAGTVGFEPTTSTV
jgi:hypothetical protein